MDNIAIENFAVSAVKDSIFTSELLSPFISDNDKEPSWDGNVYIYKNKRKRADDIIGCVPVQVKGTEKDVFTKKDISFQMEIHDLNNYLNNHGVMLFVVYVQNPDKGRQRKIYYAALTPVALRALIPVNKVKGKKSVRLKEFPSDKKKIADIFLNFYEDAKRQDSFSNAHLPTIEELKQSGQLEGLDIYASTFGNDSPENVMLNNDVYLYARIKGCAIPQPIDMMMSDMSITRVGKASVTVGGEELYSEYRIIKKKDSTSIQVGSSFTMTFPKSSEANLRFLVTALVEKKHLKNLGFKRVCRLNYFQAIKRKGALNDIEKEELYSMTEDESCPEGCKTAAYLLLDMQQMAQRHFNRMSEQEQKAFRDFPIYHFWKESQENKGVQ